MKPTFTPTPAEASAIAEALDAMANNNENGATMTAEGCFPAGRGFPVLENCQRKGATMTASELIDLLKSHPKACGVLGLTLDIGSRWTSVSDGNGVWFSDMDKTCWEGKPDYQTPRFRRWLLGAAQEWADEHNIKVAWSGAMNEWQWSDSSGQYWYGHPTRLHALLAAIEAVA